MVPRVVGLIAAAGLVGLVAMGCRRRYPPETCEPSQAASWGTPDGRPHARGPSPGCAKPRPPQGVYRQKLLVDGRERTWSVATTSALPAGQAAPLIFVLHGLGGSGEIIRRRFGLEQVAAGRALIVYPDGLPIQDFGGETGWDLRRSGFDFPFFDRMLDKLGDDHCIDLGRVFVTGHSFGGWMTNRLGFLRGSRLRGIAPSAGGLSRSDCGARPLAALIVHGRNDPTVVFAEGQAAHAMWSTAAGCGAGATPLGVGPCVLGQGCAAEAPVGLCEHDQRHAYPDFATAAIWAFFERLK